MRFIFYTLSILFLLTNTVSAQKPKKKTEVKGITKEVYFIDRDSKMMNGDYFKIKQNSKDTLVFGHFKNAMRTGKWIFSDFKTNQTQLEFDFSNDSLLFLAKEFYPDSFLVKIENEFVYTKVDRPLIFIGYKDEEKHILGTDIKIPPSMVKNNLNGTSILRFTVNNEGRVSGSNVITSFDETFENQINALIYSLDGRFLPALVNGEPVFSMFYVKVNVSSGFNFRFEQPVELPYIYDFDIIIRSTSTTHQSRKTGLKKIILSEQDMMYK